MEALEPLKGLDELYVGNLEKLRAEAVQSGNLQQVLAAKTEIEGFREGSTPEIPEAFPALRRYQGIYRAERAKRLAAVAEAMRPLHEGHHRRLVELQTQLTRQEKLDEAVEVGKAIAEVEERIASGEVPGLHIVASVPSPKGQKDAVTNSLGMTFVPVPGTEVLFCIHETRCKDYAAYAAENPPGIDNTWRDLHGVTERAGDHPVSNRSWEDAQAFCEWLSKKEGKIFRLPTDEEWSIAAGLDRKKERRSRSDTPESLHGKVKDEFPWGTEWPPPAGAGNYSDQSRKAQRREGEGYLEGYDDGFPWSAPVMSFAPNPFGLYDMGGNVTEWVGDVWREDEKRASRGAAAWGHSGRDDLLSSWRRILHSNKRYTPAGFRIVMEP